MYCLSFASVNVHFLETTLAFDVWQKFHAAHHAYVIFILIRKDDFYFAIYANFMTPAEHAHATLI